MRNLRNLGFFVAVILLAAWPAASQMTFKTPELRGVFNPTVGAGADYQDTGKDGNSNIEISIVGKESVGANTGYWVEISTAQRGNQVYLKYLMVVNGGSTTIAKSIIQMGSQPPMDMTAMMNRTGAAVSQQIDARSDANQIGTESVMTPAGTFSCQHYQAKDGSWDAWMSPGVGPWGLVKSSEKSGNTTMVVTKVFGNATTHITAVPQQFDIQQMMRQGQQGGATPR